MGSLPRARRPRTGGRPEAAGGLGRGGRRPRAPQRAGQDRVPRSPGGLGASERARLGVVGDADREALGVGIGVSIGGVVKAVGRGRGAVTADGVAVGRQGARLSNASLALEGLVLEVGGPELFPAHVWRHFNVACGLRSGG